MAYDPGWPGRIPELFDKHSVIKSGARPSWRACCPCHDDKHPSLYIYVGNSGSLVIRCMARKPQCTLENILATVGLKMSELFPPESRKTEGAYGSAGRREAVKAEPEVRRVEVQVFPYEDEHGVVLYEVVRYEPKGFAQRRAEPSSRTGYTFGLGDVRRVLYGLSQLVGPDGCPLRPREPVFVVEGERKVHAIRDMGFLATCNVGGTGMGWRPEYSLSLVGRRVVILPDNDEPGHRHAEAVAGSLMRAGAGSIRVVDLPGLPPKGDVLDFLSAGGDRESLCAAVLRSPEWKRA